MPAADEVRASSASHPAGVAPARDGRARFRALFCARAVPGGDAASPACDDLLWRLQDEAPAGAGDEAPTVLRRDLHVIVVSGAFGDCRIEDMFPYGQEIERLVAAGYRIDTLKVGGRSSSQANARQIADFVRAVPPEPGGPLVLLGYSKGAVDILQFLVDEPELAQRVAAVVSVAGPILGSPLAETADWWYRTLFSRGFGDFCAPGDGGVIASLLPATRRDWLATHVLPAHVRYYSIAAFTTREHLGRALRTTWKMLAAHDRRNDGQVLPGDASIPGGTLLGYLNADHWDVAIAIDKQLPLLSSRPSPREFPRAALFDALLGYVGADLPAAAAVGP